MRHHFCLVSILLPILVLASCQAMPETRAERADLVDNAKGELKNMTVKDPSLAALLEHCAGYAVYPEVGKGGLLFAGAFGRGAVYQRAGDAKTTADDQFLGYATVTQASVGGVVGGQLYAMLLIFEHDYDLEKFTGGDDLRFGAGASAIAITEGASAQTKFHDGVAVFIMPRGGLMADASLSGQGFSFVRPDEKDDGKPSPTTRAE
jgi:lipid-binding SYLF domain-containing protein